MSDDNVIQAFPKKEDLPECPVTLERRMSHCLHPAITLVEHDRAVVCAKCGATLDAFDYLRQGAQALRHGWQMHGQVERALKELREKYDDLEKKRRRLVGVVKRLGDKAGAAATLDMRKPL